ncbi:hypothetical protein ADICYQ_0217 [Cyclobacterium qasimii M12-11B]|uniref:Uncharacterized protein n=1 Tax=Cyclobacterium qasimii M12-11B TaxID=641524 RepID=S7WXP8_9BACT|nr:hypothetical protein ADICYQ_0217 [Cyclobacterium qasimii M12-11B]
MILGGVSSAGLGFRTKVAHTIYFINSDLLEFYLKTHLGI